VGTHDDHALALLMSLGVHVIAAVCVAIASLVALLGSWQAAAGVAAGLALHLLNVLLLVEAGRSLLGLGSRRAGRTAAFASSVGRILMLGIGLAFLGRLGQLALLAGCGTLLFTQLALHCGAVCQRRSVECSGRSSPSSAKR